MTGRPSKRTPERSRRVLKAIRDGNTRRAACAYAGISEDTLQRWCKSSAAFAESVTRAEAQAEVALVSIIRKAAPNDWRAALAILERRWSDSWARRDKVDLEVYVRQRARELGIDEDEALQVVKPHLRLVS